jgi:glutathione synthase/RimK-type ligase-like ATP-grasp enzyme
VYAQRAAAAASVGVHAVRIDASAKNVEASHEHDKLRGVWWDGKRFLSVRVDEPLVFYDKTVLTVRHLSNPRNIDDILLYALKRGALAVTPPQLRRDCTDKWKLFRCLDEAGVSTPETWLAYPDSLETALGCIDSVFVKPRSGTNGKGQFVIERIPRLSTRSPLQYSVAFPSGERKQLSSKALWSYFKKRGVHSENYIIQETVPVDTYFVEGEPRVYDFRVVLHRDGDALLGPSAVYMRVGASKKLQANIALGGFAHDPRLAFENGEELYRSLVSLAIDAARAAEGPFAFGEVGVDILRDSEGNLCVIELNSKPGFSGPRALARRLPSQKHSSVTPSYADSIAAEWRANLPRLLSRPFEYATHLGMLASRRDE